MYIAHYDHSSNGDPHLLREHVAGMLNLIRQFDLSFDQYGMTEASIILHDSGKKSARFQKYVQDPDGKRGSVQHALGGAYALYHQPYEKVNQLKELVISLVSLVVTGHHSGLDDYDANFFDKLSPEKLPSELANIEELAADEVKRVLPLLQGDLLERIHETYDIEQIRIYLSILVRFVLSALIDADYLDTAGYFSNQLYKSTYNKDFRNYQISLQEKLASLNDEAENTTLNRLRFNLQQEALRRGRVNGSFFILRAPTGTGKTLAALQFALEHAQEFHKNRIITALPLINLTEEVSALYRDLFGSENVTEDHSAVVAKTDPMKYAVSERWNTPFVVTTTVQLFESLFHHRPSKLRKLHHLYNSIIIIDEFHNLPLHVLGPIMKMLDMLQSEFNVTVLMLSATPYPVLESRVFKEMDLLHLPKKIITDDNFFKELPKRVRYTHAGDVLALSDVVDLMIEKKDSVLTIVNTRKQAQQLFYLLQTSDHGFDTIYHLSTTMCSNHRAEVIQEIKACRENSPHQKIAVISTSILEAGVDVSFPFVFRMLAPLDSIIQAAGRCNRNDEYDLGEVTLFNLKDVTYYDEAFASGVTFVEERIKVEGLASLTEEKSFISYYKRLLSEGNVNELGIESDVYMWFSYLARRFKLIEDERLSVVCPMVEGFNEAWLKEKRTRAWWEKIKPFIVPISHGLTEYEELDGLAVWKGQYDAKVGIKLL